MKKTYIKPVVKKMNINPLQMVSASNGIIFSTDDATGSGFLNDEKADEGVEALMNESCDFW